MLINKDGIHLVTPVIAEELLAQLDNSKNREIIPKRVSKYASDMVKDMWHNNYDPLRITEGGKLLDGQHRLHAIIEADLEQELYFIVGIPDKTNSGMDMFETMDMLTRKPHEILHIANPSLLNSKMIVTLIKDLTKFNHQKIRGGRVEGFAIRNDTITMIAEEFQPLSALDSHCERATTLGGRSGKRLAKDVWALLIATIGTLDRGTEFLNNLCDYSYDTGVVSNLDGLEVPLTDPLANLVFNLERSISESTGRLDRKSKITQVFNTFNAYRAGGAVTAKKLLTHNVLHYPSDYDYDEEIED